MTETLPSPPTDLRELFSRDPNDHTKESIAELIEKLRGMRTQFFVNGDKKAGRVKSTAKATKPSTLMAAGINLKIDLTKSIALGEKKE